MQRLPGGICNHLDGAYMHADPLLSMYSKWSAVVQCVVPSTPRHCDSIEATVGR